MRKLAFSLFLAMVLAVSTLALATPARATGPHALLANVKWEEGAGYEYSDGSATVSGNADQVTVAPAEGFEVVGVCIKIGVPVVAKRYRSPQAGHLVHSTTASRMSW